MNPQAQLHLPEESTQAARVGGAVLLDHSFLLLLSYSLCSDSASYLRKGPWDDTVHSQEPSDPFLVPSTTFAWLFPGCREGSYLTPVSILSSCAHVVVVVVECSWVGLLLTPSPALTQMG